MNNIDWKRKLSSRKFWAAVAGFVAGLIIYCGGSPERASSTEGLIMSAASIVIYMLAEAITDSSRADAEYVGKHLDNDDDEPD